MIKPRTEMTIVMDKCCDGCEAEVGTWAGAQWSLIEDSYSDYSPISLCPNCVVAIAQGKGLPARNSPA